MKKISYFIILIFLLFLSCKNKESNSFSKQSNSKIKIVATTSMIGDLCKNIAGERGEVVSLMGEGIDPHLYKPTRTDIVKLNSADIVFYNGLLLEGKMIDALVRIAASGKPVLAVTELLKESFLLEPKEFQGQVDPHVWMDPKAWSASAVVIANSLAKNCPDSKEYFLSSLESFKEKIFKLDKLSETALNTVSPKTRVLVTAHDAFNYFGRRYGFEVVGIQGLSTESEAGVHDLEQIVSLLVERKISAVFIESTISKRNIEALIEGAKAKNHQVEIGGRLYSDAMGKPGTLEGTYLGMIAHNVSTIVKALGGTLPEEGLLQKINQ